MNNWKSNLFSTVELIELIELLGSLILFKETCLECTCNYWNRILGNLYSN